MLTSIKDEADKREPPQPDIAQIIGQAIIEAGRNSDNAALVIAKALHNLPQPTIVQAPPSPHISGLKVVRDSKGDMTSVLFIYGKS
jgi:hypothetical protein